jgi:hypothetical protein
MFGQDRLSGRMAQGCSSRSTLVKACYIFEVIFDMVRLNVLLEVKAPNRSSNSVLACMQERAALPPKQRLGCR